MACCGCCLALRRLRCQPCGLAGRSNEYLNSRMPALFSFDDCFVASWDVSSVPFRMDYSIRYSRIFRHATTAYHRHPETSIQQNLLRTRDLAAHPRHLANPRNPQRRRFSQSLASSHTSTYALPSNLFFIFLCTVTF